MTKRRVLWASLVGLLLLGLVAAAVMAQPPGAPPGAPGGGGRGQGLGMAMAMMYLERAWATVNFELEATTEQIEELRPVFQAKWDARKAARAIAQQTNDFQTLQATMQQIEQETEAKLKEVLTPDQYQKWEQIKSQPMGLGRRGGQRGGGR